MPKPLSIIAALLAGALGAVLWAVLAYYVHVELGYLAWGIGIAVGLASGFLGGRGLSNASICVMITLFAIFGGKMLATKAAMPAIMAEIVASDEKFAEFSPEERQAFAAEMESQISPSLLFEAATSDFGMFDLLFIGLGAYSAFRAGMGPGEQSASFEAPTIGSDVPEDEKNNSAPAS